jgi:hypothetical protein
LEANLTQSANIISTFTTEQFQNLPNPGGDITTIAFTVSGLVVNVGAAAMTCDLCRDSYAK